MLVSRLRSGELRTVEVTDIDIGADRCIEVMGKGAEERLVSLNVEMTGQISTFLFTEGPGSSALALFLTAKS